LTEQLPRLLLIADGGDGQGANGRERRDVDERRSDVDREGNRQRSPPPSRPTGLGIVGRNTGITTPDVLL
jgi:hypothetical protein